MAADFAGSHLDPAVPGLLATMIGQARAAGVLVLDLRDAPWWFGRHLPEALGPLLSCDVGLPAERFRFHSGWASERADSSGGLFSGSMVKDAEVVVAAPTAGPRPRLIMMVNEHSGLPLRAAAGLVLAGEAEMVVVGPHFEPGSSVVIPLSGEAVARVRVSEWIGPDGRVGLPPAPRVRLAPGGDPAAVARVAVEAADAPPCFHVQPGPVPLVVPHTAALPTTARRPWDGSRAQRRLGFVRLWGILDEFFAYPELLGPEWEDALPSLWEAWGDAGNELEFCRAVSGMLQLLPDSHARVRAPIVAQHLGVAHPPLRVGTVEGRTVVVDSDLSGVSAGDVVTSINGGPVSAHRDRLVPWLPSSTRQALVEAVDELLLAGPPSSVVRIGLEPIGGAARTVPVERHVGRPPQRRQPAAAQLPGGVAYLDMTRVSERDLDKHWAMVAGAGAFVFDIRGYTRGAVWTLLERLGGPATVAARHRRRELRGFGPATRARIEMGKVVGRETPAASRPGVALVNAATISQAEYTALLLRSCQGTRLVGSPTNGTLGAVVTTTVSAGVTVTFTGQATLTGGGDPVHGTGLQPDRVAERTIEGLRAGRDEVLEVALDVLEESR